MAEVSIRKFITVEMMVAMLVFAFSSGGLWFGLNHRAEASESKIKEIAATQVKMQESQGEMQESISQIQTSVAVIAAETKANQTANEHRATRQDDQMDRMDGILDDLQRGTAR